MRILVATALLVAGLTLVATPADARSVACTDLVSPWCQGFLCYDKNVDGYLTYNECIVMYCPMSGCCGGPCPPPYWE